ncbi:MAG: diacylglycerol/polyprenol kinase family protein [Nitrospirota bacterium]
MKHPGRKIYHLLGGLFIIAAYIFLGRARGLPVLAALTAVATAIDASRFVFPEFNYFIFRHFRAFVRESERNTFTGTPSYLMGMLGSFFLFSLPVAVCAIIFLACGDVSATIVGERWGTVKISGVKSLQGTIAFFAASLISGAIAGSYWQGLPFYVVAAGALTASVVEILPLKFNDNLTIPIISGALMQALVHNAPSIPFLS